MSRAERYAELFARHRSAAITSLWPWQEEVLTAYGEVTGDAAVELPTGTGKTLIGLLAGEEFRDGAGPVAYLAGNKQLAQQIERQARDLGFPVVRFQGRKESWDQKDVRSYNFARAIGVMNYWNYFNASPGVEPAGMLILDDVHLLEGPLRDYFTVFVETGTRTCNRILSRIVARCPYYRLAEDLRHGVEPGRAPEMLVFPDSADLANEVRDLLDARIEAYSDPWWAWLRIRDHLEVCCWLLSPRGITFTPYIPPAQTIDHFQEPERRLYLSATVGSVDDLQRRLGTPPFVKLTASAQPRQGERFVLMRNSTKELAPAVARPRLAPVSPRPPQGSVALRPWRYRHGVRGGAQRRPAARRGLAARGRQRGGRTVRRGEAAATSSPPAGTTAWTSPATPAASRSSPRSRSPRAISRNSSRVPAGRALRGGQVRAAGCPGARSLQPRASTTVRCTC